MKKTPFLKQIAYIYFEKERDNLKNYTFIFPNRRSMLFFSSYLEKEIGNTPFVMPEMLPINEFITNLSGLSEATPIELKVVLYKKYTELKKDVGDMTFDSFLFLSDIILNDFNDVDKFYADPEAIFKNTRDLHDLKANYLSPELIEELSHYFNINNVSNIDYGEKMWKHVSGNTDIQKNFLNLWDILYDLYTSVNITLADEYKGYQGAIYRKAYDNIKGFEAEDFNSRKYIFIGFNALSTTEYLIFRKFRELGIGDYYWDFVPEMHKSQSVFMQNNLKEFKSEYAIDLTLSHKPNINVLSIPSNIGQVKKSVSIASKIVKNNASSPGIETAIILPSESLFMPILSMGDELSISKDGVNITFGIPMKNSAVATLINCIYKMHKRAKEVKGELQFRKDDFLEVLSHPFVYKIAPNEAMKIQNDILRMMYVPQNVIDSIKNVDMKEIFKNISDLKERTKSIEYIRKVLDIINSVIGENRSLNKKYVEEYRKYFLEVDAVLEENDIELISADSYLYLIDRLISSMTVPLKGEPLNGIQVMGFLESRSLDFKNIIIPSVNEDVLPRKKFSKSFIPNFVRKAYGISTTEFQESLFSYYFFRLLARAENVYLIYDSRKTAMGSGEYSRYVYQLKYLYKNEVNMTFVECHFPFGKVQDNGGISINKTDKIITTIEKFFNPEEMGKWHLSASALKTYLQCPLKFYLKYIEGLYYEDKEETFIDSATFGTIIHDSLCEIYKSDKYFSAPAIDGIKNIKVKGILTRNINRIYLHLPEKSLETPLDGESLVIFNAAKLYVDGVLDYDKGRGPFEILELEGKKVISLKVDSTEINFSYTIDRVDFENNVLRIIDYKTGTDKNSTANINNIFKPDHSFHAIFQLLLYCHAFRQEHPEYKTIKPELYRLLDVKNNPDFGIKINKSAVNNYYDVEDEFISKFTGILTELRDKDTPFRQCDKDEGCVYCGFKEICRNKFAN